MLVAGVEAGVEREARNDKKPMHFFKALRIHCA